jgi:four helix bundle protein
MTVTLDLMRARILYGTSPRTTGYNGRVTPDRPDYKSHPLWTQAMALARAAYAVAEEIAERDPEEARLLRKAAVSIPAKVAAALAADEALARESDALLARAALDEVATRAERLPTRHGSSRQLVRQARELERSVKRVLGSEGFVS